MDIYALALVASYCGQEIPAALAPPTDNLFDSLPMELLVVIIAASLNFMSAAHTCRSFRAATMAVKLPPFHPKRFALRIWKLAAATSADEIDEGQGILHGFDNSPIANNMYEDDEELYFSDMRESGEIYLALHVPFLKREAELARRALTGAPQRVCSQCGGAAAESGPDTAVITAAKKKLLQIERLALRNLFYGAEELNQSLQFLSLDTLARLALYTVEPYNARITQRLMYERDWRELPDKYVLALWYRHGGVSRGALFTPSESREAPSVAGVSFPRFFVERAEFLSAEVDREIAQIKGDKKAAERLAAGEPVAMSDLLKWACVAVAAVDDSETKTRKFLHKQLLGFFGRKNLPRNTGKAFRRIWFVCPHKGRFCVRYRDYLTFDEFDGEFHYEVVPNRCPVDTCARHEAPEGDPRPARSPKGDLL